MNYPYLAELNPMQAQAVEYTNGPLMIVAGAGTGKTKTLTYRILHLIHTGVLPEHILAVTFTNKAAHEMRERVKTLLHKYNPEHSTEKTTMPTLKTFHGLGVMLLRQFYQQANIRKEFTILDTADGMKLIKESMEELGIDIKKHEPKLLRSIISSAQNKGTKLSDFERDTHSENTGYAARVWKLYEAKKAREHALDFDDLLIKLRDLLHDNESVRNYLQNKFQYIHIDEYQDTNNVQYEIARLLTGPLHNICVVGDTDQNIYSWRGANIKNMMSFETDFPEARIILLEQNYRSTKNILTAAGAIIAENKIRIDKTLYTDNHTGEPIDLFIGMNERDEAYFVADSIKKLITSGVSPNSIAILFRTHFQSRILEEQCLQFNIPYHVLGVKFFDRKEIKDLVAYIRYALNPDSLSDLRRIINEPKRGIGQVGLVKIMSGQAETLSGSQQASFMSFQTIMADIADHSQRLIPSELVRFTIHKSGMFNAYSTGSTDEHERLETMEELVTYALAYDDREIGTGILDMLEDIALLSEQDGIKEGTESVKLMTIHASKGLEFPYVFITGLEQGLFPHAGFEDKKNAEDAEEERRLFYVAITRAMKKLYLSYAYSRTIFGKQTFNEASQFIANIPAEIVSVVQSDFSDYQSEDKHVKTVYLDW